MDSARRALRRFRQHRVAVAAFAVLGVLLLMFTVGPWLSPYTFDQINIADRAQGPSWRHPFGTDPLGRDLFVRVLRGGRSSVRIALIVSLVSTIIGTVLGACAGYFQRWVDSTVSQIINLFLLMPALIVLFVFAIQYGSKPLQVSILLGCLLWVTVARVVRGLVLQLSNREFVDAARAAGAGPWRVIVVHILPNALGAIVVQATLVAGAAIIIESTLAFLGLGVQPPETSLGVLVSDGKGLLRDRPWEVLIPGSFIVALVLCVNFLGDGLRDAVDPTSSAAQGSSAK